jgi:hypothetical protein
MKLGIVTPSLEPLLLKDRVSDDKDTSRGKNDIRESGARIEGSPVGGVAELLRHCREGKSIMRACVFGEAKEAEEHYSTDDDEPLVQSDPPDRTRLIRPQDRGPQVDAAKARMQIFPADIYILGEEHTLLNDEIDDYRSCDQGLNAAECHKADVAVEGQAVVGSEQFSQLPAATKEDAEGEDCVRKSAGNHEALKSLTYCCRSQRP